MNHRLASIDVEKWEGGAWVARIHYRGSRIAPGARLCTVGPTWESAYEQAKKEIWRFGYTRHCVRIDEDTAADQPNNVSPNETMENTK